MVLVVKSAGPTAPFSSHARTGWSRRSPEFFGQRVRGAAHTIRVGIRFDLIHDGPKSHAVFLGQVLRPGQMSQKRR